MKTVKTTCMTALLALCLTGSPALAQDRVILESIDGGVRMEGVLLSVDARTFELETQLGRFSISRATSVCVSGACPVEVPQVEDVVIATDGPVLDALVKQATDAFADARRNRVADLDAPEGIMELAMMKGADQMLARVRVKRDGEASIRIRPAPVNGHSADAVVLGRDALIVHTGRGAGGTSLTTAQLTGILTGAITNWTALGGPDLAIEVLRPADGTSADTALRALLPRGANSIGSDLPQGVPLDEYLATRPAALAIGLWSETGAAKALAISAGCAAPVRPDPFLIASGFYPLSQVVVAEPKIAALGETATAFLSFLEGEVDQVDFADGIGQRAIASGGYATTTVMAAPIDGQGDYLARSIAGASSALELTNLKDLFSDMIGAQQVSTVFRFASNSNRLPEHGRTLARDLGAYLSSIDMTGKDVVQRAGHSRKET